MKEIKLRAWDKVLNQMVNVTSIDFSENGKVYFSKSESDWTKRKYLEIMQFTGLSDKNGVEIFEGDILDNTNYCNFSVKEKIGEVKMGELCDSNGYNNGVILGWNAGNSSLLDVCKKSKVIGNIYQNKDLLTNTKG